MRGGAGARFARRPPTAVPYGGGSNERIWAADNA